MNSGIGYWLPIFLIGISCVFAGISIGHTIGMKAGRGQIIQLPIPIGDEVTPLGNYLVVYPLKVKDRVEFSDKLIGIVVKEEMVRDGRATCGISTLYMIRLEGGGYRGVLMRGTGL